jgi:hypothetical protein
LGEAGHVTPRMRWSGKRSPVNDHSPPEALGVQQVTGAQAVGGFSFLQVRQTPLTRPP